MRGKSHFAMNAATGVVLFDSAFLIANTESPDWLKTGVAAIQNFLIPEETKIPVYLFVIFAVALFLFGSLIPDIDTPYSSLGRIIHIPVEHRTWTHAIWWPVLFCIAGIWFRLLFWFGLGIFFHDFWDAFSASGLHWFYPIKNKHHKLKLYYTGKPSEYVTVGVFWTLAVIYTIFVAEMVYGIFQQLFH